MNFPWLITLCQTVLSQRGRKWLNLPSMAPHNLWKRRRRLKSDQGQTEAEKRDVYISIPSPCNIISSVSSHLPVSCFRLIDNRKRVIGRLVSWLTRE